MSRAQLISLLRVIEPAELAGRKGNKLKRKRFWATGVNDVWAFDQHDKWKRFGLLLHVGVEVYAGRVLWLKVWWSNRTPALLASYYFGAVRETGGQDWLWTIIITYAGIQVFPCSRRAIPGRRLLALRTRIL